MIFIPNIWNYHFRANLSRSTGPPASAILRLVKFNQIVKSRLNYFTAVLKTAIVANLLLLSFTQTYPQEIVIRKVELNNGKILLHYDLMDDNPDHRYFLQLYSSMDNFAKPLKKVTGDIGIGIPIGNNKVVTWDVSGELNTKHEGTIFLSIKGQVYIPFIIFTHFSDHLVFRRGKSYFLTWSAEKLEGNLNFDLYHGENKIWTLPDVPNTGRMKLVIPIRLKPADNFQFRISDSEDDNKLVYTDKFKIIRRIPIGAKIGLSAIVTAAAIILLQPQPTSDEIPDPILPKL